MTTDYQTKEAKIKELIAKATSPRDKAFYQGLLKKAIASRPVQVMEFAESLQSETCPQSASVTEKKQKTSSSTTDSDKSQSSKPNQKSEKIIQDDYLVSEINLLIKQLIEAQSQLPKSPSQSESQSKSSTESNSRKDQRPPVKFQAIGVIKGLVVYSEKKLKIQLSSSEYELHIEGQPQPDKKEKFEALKQEIKAKGSSEHILVVYPQVHYFKKGEEGKRRVSFRFVSSQKANSLPVNWHELRDREFRISGLWQYIPRCSEPCLTVRKNWSSSLEKWVAKMTIKKKVKKLKPAHLPTEWLDAPVEPFRYSPESEQKGEKSWFVRVKAVFVPGEDKFKVIGQLAEPTLERPRYLSAHP